MAAIGRYQLIWQVHMIKKIYEWYICLLNDWLNWTKLGRFIFSIKNVSTVILSRCNYIYIYIFNIALLEGLNIYNSIKCITCRNLPIMIVCIWEHSSRRISDLVNLIKPSYQLYTMWCWWIKLSKIHKPKDSIALPHSQCVWMSSL